jgi:hypothetical protein
VVIDDKAVVSKSLLTLHQVSVHLYAAMVREDEVGRLLMIGLIHSGCVGLEINGVEMWRDIKTGFSIAVALIFEKLKFCYQELFEVKRVGFKR